jgi:hypothetical protein
LALEPTFAERLTQMDRNRSGSIYDDIGETYLLRTTLAHSTPINHKTLRKSLLSRAASP